MIRDALIRRYRHCPKESWFVLSRKTLSGWEYTSYQVSDLDQAIKNVEARANENTYSTMSVFARKPQAQGTKDEVLGTSWLWVDVDSHEPSDPTPEQWKSRIDLMTPKPTLVTFTGRGYHLAWELNSLVTDRSEIEGRNNYLISVIGGNDSSWNVNRCLRVPGTRNAKSGVTCEVVTDTGRVYDIETIGTKPPPNTIPEIANLRILPLPDDFLERLEKRNPKLARRITDEEYVAQTQNRITADRSANDYYICSTLVNLGYSADELASVLTHPTWFSGSKGRDTRWSYIERTISAAFVQHLANGDLNVRSSKGHFSAQTTANSIITAYNVKFFQGALYSYVGNHYQHGVSNVISSTLWEKLGEDMRSQHTVEAERIIQQMAHTLDVGSSNDSENWVCLQNGLLNLESRTLIPHSPDRFVPDILPVEYDENADPGEVLEYLRSTIDEGFLPVFLEHLGHCLTTEVIYPGMLFLSGFGGTGKSQLLHVVYDMLGPSNCVSVDFGSLTSEKKYSLSNLIGVRANIVFDDAVSGKIPYAGRVKSLVQNEPVEVEAKYQQPQTLKLSVKFWFGVNQIAEIRNVDSGIQRRMLNLVCDHIWRPGEAGYKPRAGELLVRDRNNRSALLNLALDGLDNLRANKDYSRTESIEKSNHQWRYDTDTTVSFIDDWTEDKEGGKVSVDGLFKSYEAYCVSIGQKPVGKITFNRKLQERARTDSDFKIKMLSARLEGEVRKIWEGREYIGKKPGTIRIVEKERKQV